MSNGKTREYDPNGPLPPVTNGWILDPKNPDPYLHVEQYPLCNVRTKKLRRVCGGTLLEPYCKTKRKFVTVECVHCEQIVQSSESSDS